MSQSLKNKAVEALKYNDVGIWTRPAPDLYPHQWLWDSCFIAIGLAHVDPQRAQQEIASLFRGQWSNGMVPNMIFAEDVKSHYSADLWQSKTSPYAPHNISTTGITQPPMIAEATLRVGKHLPKAERHTFYKKIFPRLVAYHDWLYRERNPHAHGLVILIHPWETGMDNTPGWMEEIRKHQKPLWIKLVELLHFDVIIERLRRDTRQVPAEERTSTIESLLLYNVVRRLRRKQYNCERILLRSHFLIEDLFFNCILIRNNACLLEIADEINAKIPRSTRTFMNKATKSLDELWDEDAGMYYSRNFVTRSVIKESSLATLMPLYAGTISKQRAKQLVDLLKNEHHFGLKYPVPSVPLSSRFFNHRRYWQGPTWINTNWLIIDGLKRYGFKDEAKQLTQTTLELVEKSGFHEYFSPLDGYGAGIQPFSWSAALTIDLLADKSSQKKISK